jgi:phosphoribosyl 1,2-cyclic phosphodiesterase
MFFVRFWGVRGSVACPGEQTNEFGGNTACIELRVDGRLIIIDLGTGIKGLANYLLSEDLKGGPIDADVFLSHTHLDHLIGFPFFAPIYIPATKLRIHGPILPGEKSLRSVFESVISYEYWPISVNELSADISFSQHREETIDLGGGLVVKTKFLNHTVITLGFRFEYKGKSIVIAYDTEPFWNLFKPQKDKDFFETDAENSGELASDKGNSELMEFYKDADIIIFDAQYTEEEYLESKLNWGHSTYEYAVETANKINAKKLLLFHHDPGRTDSDLHKLEDMCKKKYNTNPELQIMMAREGLVVEA